MKNRLSTKNGRCFAKTFSVTPRRGLQPDEAPHYIGRIYYVPMGAEGDIYVGDRNLCTNLCSDMIVDSDMGRLMVALADRFNFARAEANTRLNFDNRAWKGTFL